MKLNQLTLAVVLGLSSLSAQASVGFENVSSSREMTLNTEQLLKVNTNSLVNLTIPFEKNVLPLVIEYRTEIKDGIAYLSGYYANHKDKRLSLRYDNGSWSGYINTDTQKYIVGSTDKQVFITAVGNEIQIDNPADDLFSRIRETKDKGVYDAQLDYHKIMTTKENSEITLNLPDVGKTAIVYEKSEQTESGNTNWVGYLRDYGNDYRAILTYGPEGVVGKVSTPDGEFQLNNNQLTNMEKAGNSVAQNLGPDAVMPMIDSKTLSAMSVAKKESAVAVPGVMSATVAPSTELVPIDLFIYYTNGFATKQGTGTGLRIDNLIAISNQAYVDSKVFIKLRLAGKKQVDYTDDSKNSTALSNLLNNIGPFATKKTDRANSGADMLILLRPFKYPVQASCGVAYIGGANGTGIKYYSNYMVSVVSDGKDANGSGYYCQDLTFVHELGHNMGSMHDRKTVASQGGAGSFGAFPYSFGYNGTKSKFGTVMSYTQPRVGKFSNPNINTCPNNEACGVVETDPNLSANNALSLNNTRFDVSNFMATKLGPLTSTTTGTGTGTGTTTTTTPPPPLPAPTVAKTTISGGIFGLTTKKSTTTETINGVRVTKTRTTINVSGLAGITVTATGASGATCEKSSTNGLFVCSVPVGWTGRLTPVVAGKTVSPGYADFTNVKTAIGGVTFQAK